MSGALRRRLRNLRSGWCASLGNLTIVLVTRLSWLTNLLLGHYSS